MVAPVLEEIAADAGDQLTVAKIDVDANPETARDFQVVSIPTMILFKDGAPVKRIVGAKGKAALLRELSDAVLGSPSRLEGSPRFAWRFSRNRGASATIAPSLSIQRQGLSPAHRRPCNVETARRRRRGCAAVTGAQRSPRSGRR